MGNVSFNISDNNIVNIAIDFVFIFFHLFYKF